MTYRPEIDGLRALAVLAVIFAHAGFTPFGGGFIGVDVFFVISGYLITTIILGEYAQGRFSLVRFYERRARRILPALFFVILCTIPFAWMWLLPGPYEQFSKSVMMTALSVSNIYFMRKTDYFAPDASEIPLLHTWSLGVEEQFYLFFALLFLFRLRIGTLFRIVIAVAAVSLLASEVGSRYFPVANYYLLPTRIWEMMAGSICAFYVFGRERPRNAALAALGLGLVLLSVLLFEPTTPVPSLIALLPVGGTALFLLYASGTTWTGRLMATAPLVWIGRISFSAYLWHQPIFAFWRIRNPEPPTTLAMCGLIVLTLLLSVFSWWVVEEPFRRRKFALSRVFSATAAATLAFVGFGAWGDVKEGLPFRLPENVREFADRTTWSRNCLYQVKDGIPPLPNSECMFNIGGGKTVAFWGDSIASSISPALADELKSRNIGMVQLTYGFCAPILGVWTSREQGAVNCEEFNNRAMDYLVSSNIDTVVLTASWVNFFNAAYMRIDGKDYAAADISEAALADNLRETVQRLQATGKQVLVVYPGPRFVKPVIDVMAERFMIGDTAPDFAMSYAAFQANTQKAYRILDAALPEGVKKVLPEHLFCDAASAKACYFGRDGVAYIADRGHFTREGAEPIASSIMEALFGAESTAGPTALRLPVEIMAAPTLTGSR